MQDRRLTIADVARMADTSTATVSHYLNGKLEKMGAATRKRIEKVIEDTGYVPNAQAQGLARGHSGVIAILILDNSNVWAGQFVSGVEAHAHEAGYQTVVCDTHFDAITERSYVEKMLSLGVDGFAIQPTNGYRGIRNRIEKAGRPVVFFDFNLMDLESTWVKTNLYDGVYDSISSCVERGYEDFVLVSSEPSSRTRMERQQGFLDALAEQGLAHRGIEIAHGRPGEAELAHWFEQNLNVARRTLVFCPHQWALGRVFSSLRSMKQLMPERVGLLGLNNADWASLTTPGISTIIEPVREEGEVACDMLLELLADKSHPAHQQTLRCETRWLGSTL